jgi:hypothetical protein
MKKIIASLIMFALLSAPAYLSAQESKVNDFFDKYSDNDKYTSVEIAKGLFELFANIDSDDEDFDEFKKAAEGIDKLRLVSYSVKNGDIPEKERFYNDIKSSIPFNKYDELMIIKKPDAKINFYSKGGGRNISELLMVVDGDTDVIFLSITGNIDLKHLAKLGSSMNFEGMNYLGEMDGE